MNAARPARTNDWALIRAQEGGSAISLSGSNLLYVVVVALVAVAALVMAGLFRREVLAASEGTEKMKAIALAIQEARRPT